MFFSFVSVWRHVQEFGFQKKYSEDSEFALQLRMLPALAFVPKDDVISSYSVIKSNYYTKNEEPIFRLFRKYLVRQIRQMKKTKTAKNLN